MAWKAIEQDIERRENIKRERAEFEKIMSDAQRYRIPGRAQYEERFRKVLNEDLPPLEAKLLQALGTPARKEKKAG